METPRGEVHGSFFTGYVQLASQNLCRMSTYVVASYRPLLCPILGKTDHKKLFHSYHQNSHVCIEKHQNEKTEISLAAETSKKNPETKEIML